MSNVIPFPVRPTARQVAVNSILLEAERRAVAEGREDLIAIARQEACALSEDEAITLATAIAAGLI